MFKLPFATRTQALMRETSFEILARAKALEAQGREIVHLEIGEPDADTPDYIKRAAIAALESGYTHYAPSAGLMQAREAIAAHVARDRGVDVRPDQVVITPGAKAVIFYTILALVEPGDEVIYPNPGFPNYEAVIEFAGGVPVPLELREENEFSIDINRFGELVTNKTKLCIVNTPQNPTGAMLPSDVVEAIAAIAGARGFYVLSDEVYSKITYDAPHTSFYAVPGARERTILVDSHSKTYAMTGWRFGYGVMPGELAVRVARLASNCNSCTSPFVQLAGIEALRGPQDFVRNMVAEFRARRAIIVEGLNRIPGFRCAVPRGAFYVFPNIEGTGMSSQEFAEFLMEKAGVAVLSGTTFGKFGEGYVRMSYANSQENIRCAIEKIASALAS